MRRKERLRHLRVPHKMPRRHRFTSNTRLSMSIVPMKLGETGEIRFVSFMHASRGGIEFALFPLIFFGAVVGSLRLKLNGLLCRWFAEVTGSRIRRLVSCDRSHASCKKTLSYKRSALVKVVSSTNWRTISKCHI